MEWNPISILEANGLNLLNATKLDHIAARAVMIAAMVEVKFVLVNDYNAFQKTYRFAQQCQIGAKFLEPIVSNKTKFGIRELRMRLDKCPDCYAFEIAHLGCPTCCGSGELITYYEDKWLIYIFDANKKPIKELWIREHTKEQEDDVQDT